MAPNNKRCELRLIIRCLLLHFIWNSLKVNLSFLGLHKGLKQAQLDSIKSTCKATTDNGRDDNDEQMQPNYTTITHHLFLAFIFYKNNTQKRK